MYYHYLFIYLFIYFEVLRQQEVEYSKVESFMETMSKSSFNLYCMVIFMSEAGQACSKRRATAVPNSNEFGSAVARR